MAAAKESVRAAMDSLIGQAVLEGSPHYMLICGLWERSPEFRSGPVYFTVERNQSGRPSLRAVCDGATIDWSVRAAIAGKRPTLHTQLTLAMRRSIRPQVLKFKNELEDRRCQECGQAVEHFEADHVVPFIVLMRGYLESRGGDVPTELAPIMGGYAFKPSDQQFEAGWLAWHEQRAQLRALCRSCHLAVGRAARCAGPLPEAVAGGGDR